jgi:Family of unknown function (DUF6318)
VGVRVGVIAVAVVLAVAGCSGGDAPPSALPSDSAPPQSSSPPPNPPSTAATTSTPTSPPLPATATQDTPAGAASFARYYIGVLDYASHTGDVGSLRRLGNCGTCRAQANGIEKFFKEGGRVEGGEIHINGTEAVRFLRTAALVNVTYDQAAGKSISGEGRTENSPALKSETFALTLSRLNDSWSVQKMQTVQ